MVGWLGFLLRIGLLAGVGCGLPGQTLAERCRPGLEARPGMSGLAVLDRGEEALVLRGWLGEAASRTLDIQYFIWTADNVGVLASEAFLRAADRGVRVRVLVDDLLVDAPPEALLALAAHPNIDIRIYNPLHQVGTSTLGRVGALVTRFRDANQRMHDKVAVFDGVVGITGGRNMADEYFDLDQGISFRDRDVLAVGPVVAEMAASFQRFWDSPLARPVEALLPRGAKRLTPAQVQGIYARLRAYATDPANYAPDVRRAVGAAGARLEALLRQLHWSDVRFLSDTPGKNTGRQGLKGSGASTEALLQVVRSARKRVVIQSPYVVLSSVGKGLLRELKTRGVRVQISTNSLASTDNLQAFSGYRKQRRELLRLGAEVYEFRPDAALRTTLLGRPTAQLSLHAKSLVVDGETVFIGTFNLDPRSANLNTEVGVLTRDPALAAEVEQAILRDMAPENSWSARDNPDHHAPFAKRQKVRFWKLLPLTPIL